MAALLSIVALVCGLAGLVCWIIVLIKMFGEHVGLGIIGILCGLVAFIWGWIKAGELGLTKVMMWWTLAIVAQIVVQVITMVLYGEVTVEPIPA